MIERLRAAGYPLSGEQAEAIRWGAKGQVAIIEGAAGSGKTTILRPLADLYREAGYRIVPTAVAWKVAAALGTDTNAHPYAVETVPRGEHAPDVQISEGVGRGVRGVCGGGIRQAARRTVRALR